MGKTKKQKMKEQDFRKPKLKVGKKRPEGSNVTKTVFKAATIQLSSQLQEKREPTNKRKLTMQDLLGQMNHYNSNIRMGAVVGLKELLVDHPHLLLPNLSKILPKLCEKFVDTDGRVREALIACLSHLLNNISESELQPFFDLLSAHLKCSMTHINEEIQIHSLRILDLGLTLFPRLFKTNCAQLLHTIIGLMSKKYKSSTSTQTVASDEVKKGIFGGLRFFLEPNKKLSNLSTRNDMLKRLHTLIDNWTTTSNNCETNFQSPTFSGTMRGVDLIDVRQKTVMYNLTPLSQYLSSDGIDQLHSDSTFSESDFFPIVPLLLDTWIDCSPYQFASGFIDKSLTTVVLESMVNVTNILAYMSSICSSDPKDSVSRYNDFKSMLKEHFIKYFPLDFPKEREMEPKKKRKVTFEEINHALFVVNISLAKVLCTLLSNAALVDTKKEWMDLLLKYFHTTMSKESPLLIQSHIKSFMNMATLLISSAEIEKAFIVMEGLMNLYRRSNIYTMQRIAFVSFLRQLADNSRTSHLLIQAKTKSWLDSLTADLPKSLRAGQSRLFNEIVLFHLTLLKQNLAENSFRTEVSSAMENIFGSTVEQFHSLTEEFQLRTVELLYYCPVPLPLARTLASFCNSSRTQSRVKLYMVHIVTYRSMNNVEGGKDNMPLEIFLSFLFSVIIGHSKDSLQCIQSSQPDLLCRPHIIKDDTVMTTPSDKMQTQEQAQHADLISHEAFVETCVEGLRMHPLASHMRKLLEDNIIYVMKSHALLPEKTVLGLLILEKTLLTTCGAFATSEEASCDTIPIISSSLLQYESAEILGAKGNLYVQKGSTFLSPISKAAISVINQEPKLVDDLFLFWTRIIEESSDNTLGIGIAELFSFVLRVLKVQRISTAIDGLLNCLSKSNAMLNRRDLLAELKYAVSVGRK